MLVFALQVIAIMMIIVCLCILTMIGLTIHDVYKERQENKKKWGLKKGGKK